MTRLSRRCSCGLHERSDVPFPEQAVRVSLLTEAVCVSTRKDKHATYRTGRRCGLVTIRIPYRWALWLQSWRKSAEVQPVEAA